MSGSDAYSVLSQTDLDSFRRVCDAIRHDVETQSTTAIPSDVIASLLTTGTLAYRAVAQEEKRALNVFAKDAEVTPTAVVVTVSAMLRAVDLNSFDLAMWFTGAPAGPSQ